MAGSMIVAWRQILWVALLTGRRKKRICLN
jgi:hypothetical protein